ncbi:exocyst complex component Sec6 [Zalerion maritima]|uniref:Exocyst complex component Sec6 n=1 Tax=Zalerion maritima TaxID=339359 RepID=A0AAD5RYW7_9PEZI|nr:exocyst complex component Sec6 [Zalerion maritima]
MDGPIVQLEELLRHPDDLDKITGLKQEFARKKNAVDSQLRAGLREQLETTQSGMNGLVDGQRTLQAIKEEMMQIDKLCSESQVMIQDFANINLVSKAHHNFAAVEAMRRNLETFNERVQRLQQMLGEDDDDMVNMPNLLPVHYELTQLRNIRDDAMEQIQRADDTSLKQTLEEYFENLEGVIDWFDDHIGTIAMNLINLLINDNEGLVVRLAIIIEAEEKSDEKVLALQEALKDHKDMATRFQMITDGAKQVRGYKEKFLECIKAAAESNFREARGTFMEDPAKLEKSFKWYFNDLNAVKKGMVPLTPKKWKILKTYGNIYHTLMHDFLIEIVDDPETTSAHTLEIVGWPDKYYSKMKRLGFKQDELAPHVIDNREAELVREFRQRIIMFLDEWIENIFTQEKKDFLERTEETPNIDTDEYQYFRTRYLVDLWRMLREQIDVAGNSKRADVVEGVIDAMMVRLRSRQADWQKMLDDEASRYESTKPQLELTNITIMQDWLVATANDQIATIDDNEDRTGYLTEFRQRFEPLVTPQYMERADVELATLRDGYIDFSTWCMTRFATLILTVDFKSVMPELFTPKWYGSMAMKNMISTFDDYLIDYREMLHHSLVDIFTEIFANELLVRYLGGVHNKGAKFKRTDPFEEQMTSDIKLAFEYFDQLPNEDLKYGIRNEWRVIQNFLALLKADKEKVADVFEDFKANYWDLQIGWVEAVLRSRDDFERSMLNSVKARAAQMDVVRGGETIMGKVK